MAPEKKKKNDPDPGKVIHERTRFLILAGLAGCGDMTMSFNDLKKDLGLTSGNLSVHLKCLEGSGLVRIKKKFVDKKPLTLAVLSEKGLKTLDEYLGQMENIIRKLRDKR